MPKRDRHAEHCIICKSASLNDLEAEFMDGASVLELAQRHGFEEHTVKRHVAARGLRAKRLSDALGCVQSVIEHCQTLRGQGRLQMHGNTEVSAIRVMGELQGKIAMQNPLIVRLMAESPEVQAKIEAALYSPEPEENDDDEH